jgi:hypothetical protein
LAARAAILQFTFSGGANMLTQQNTRRRLAALAILVLALGLLSLTTVRAQDKKSDATGTWKWSQEGFGQQQDFVLKLKQDGDKVTGTLAGGFDQSEVAIQDGKIKDGEVTFKISRDFGGRPITTIYTGKLSGDSFKGKSETIIAQDFDAKRS